MQREVHLLSLGRLRWVDGAGVWSGQLRLRSGRTVPLDIVPDGEHAATPDAPAVFVAAEAGTAWLRRHERQALLAAAGSLVPGYNEQAAGEQEPVTAAEFAGWLEVAAVRVSSRGGFVLTLGDSDTGLFGGMTAIADFDPEYRLTITMIS
jgi:hypothetical protein